MKSPCADQVCRSSPEDWDHLSLAFLNIFLCVCLFPERGLLFCMTEFPPINPALAVMRTLPPSAGLCIGIFLHATLVCLKCITWRKKEEARPLSASSSLVRGS